MIQRTTPASEPSQAAPKTLIRIAHRIRRASVLVAALSVAIAGASPDARADFGLGIVLGEPTGISGKYRQSAQRGIQGGLAWSFDSYMLLFGDYLFSFPGAFGSKTRFVSQLSPYIGIGGTMFFGNNVRPRSNSSFGLGIRIPLGLEWNPGDPPLGVFVELAPGLGLVPGTFGFLQGGIGIRYYF